MVRELLVDESVSSGGGGTEPGRWLRVAGFVRSAVDRAGAVVGTQGQNVRWIRRRRSQRRVGTCHCHRRRHVDYVQYHDARAAICPGTGSMGSVGVLDRQFRTVRLRADEWPHPNAHATRFYRRRIRSETLWLARFHPFPVHFAVLCFDLVDLDGNGRWAKSKGLKRLDGHRKGAEAVDNLLDTLLELQIKFVSLYVFSTENWKRPRTEITGLFKLLDEFITKREERMLQKGIKLHISGDLSRIPAKVRIKIENVQNSTAKGKNLTANFCLNYGSKDEILRAAMLCYQQMQLKKISRISEKMFSQNLDTAGLPDIDLLIRTAGEKRLSNFLLWQSAYAELYFTDTLWPDFSKKDLLAAVVDYQSRIRKFGAIADN